MRKLVMTCHPLQESVNGMLTIGFPEAKPDYVPEQSSGDGRNLGSHLGFGRFPNASDHGNDPLNG